MFCPKCDQPFNEKENKLIYQVLSLIEVIEIESLDSPPLPTKYVEAEGRYMCPKCETCFIIEVPH